jgi:flavorubredoxin
MGTILFDNGKHQCIKFDDLTEGGEIQSNQFLIIHDRRGLLIDCGGYRIYQHLLGAVSRYLPAGSIDYIFLSHQDPDIGSGLNLWLPVCKAQVLVSALWIRFIPAFCVRGLSETRATAIPDQGLRIQLAGCELFAIPAHFLHSPGNFQLYDPVSKILFTGDLGASLAPEKECIATAEEFERHIESMAGFHRRYMASREFCRKWAEMIRPMDIDMIVPQHGARITGPTAVNLFREWVAQEQTASDGFIDTAFRLPFEIG